MAIYFSRILSQRLKTFKGESLSGCVVIFSAEGAYSIMPTGSEIASKRDLRGCGERRYGPATTATIRDISSLRVGGPFEERQPLYCGRSGQRVLSYRSGDICRLIPLGQGYVHSDRYDLYVVGEEEGSLLAVDLNAVSGSFDHENPALIVNLDGYRRPEELLALQPVARLPFLP